MIQMRSSKGETRRKLGLVGIMWLVGSLSSLGLANGQNSQGSVPWKVSMEKAVDHFKAGNTAGAVTAARAALKQVKSEPSPNPQHIFDVQLGLASMLLQTGATEEAKTLVMDAQGAAQTAVKAAQEKVAVTLKYLGAMHMMAKDYPAAEKTYRQAVKLSKSINGPKHPETAKHLGNLGAILLAQKKLKDSHRQLVWSMEIWDAQPTPDPVYTAGTMITLAQVELEQNQKKTALARYAKAIRIQEDAFGPNDPRRLKAQVKYVEFLRNAGETQRADELKAKYDRK